MIPGGQRTEKGERLFCVDVAVGPVVPFGQPTRHKIDYVPGQILDGIEWQGKTPE